MNRVEPGAPAPDFALPDLDGQMHRLSDLAGHIVVLDFWSAECPWSSHYDPWLSRQVPVWAQQDIRLLAVASNGNESVDLLRGTALERSLPFSILVDAGSKVADLYGAQTTPHLFVIDRGGRVAYQGAVDDRTFRKREAEVNFLEQALAALRQGKEPQPAQTDPYGCTIVRLVEE